MLRNELLYTQATPPTALLWIGFAPHPVLMSRVRRGFTTLRGLAWILCKASLTQAWSAWCPTLCQTALLQAVCASSKEPFLRAIKSPLWALSGGAGWGGVLWRGARGCGMGGAWRRDVEPRQGERGREIFAKLNKKLLLFLFCCKVIA